MQAIVPLDREHDLCYSPDDDGWYIQRGNEASQMFYNRKQARRAWRNRELVWENESEGDER